MSEYSFFVMIIPFAVYGLYRFVKWWISMVWQKETDTYDSNDSFFVVLPTVIFICWVFPTLFLIDGVKVDDINFIVFYIFTTFFGPFTFVLGFVRFFGFGNTLIGKKLGCYPPTKTFVG